MEQEKILSVVAKYRQRFEARCIPKKKMDPHHFFLSKEEMLAHAHFLLDGIEEYARNPQKEGKTGRHLGSVQTLLWVAEWYTLEDLMNHNRH